MAVFVLFVTSQDNKYNLAGQMSKLFASCIILPIILIIIITAWDTNSPITHQFLAFLNTMSACLDEWQLDWQLVRAILTGCRGRERDVP